MQISLSTLSKFLGNSVPVCVICEEEGGVQCTGPCQLFFHEECVKDENQENKENVSENALEKTNESSPGVEKYLEPVKGPYEIIIWKKYMEAFVTYF